MKVMTFSRTYPAYHPKAGQRTYFVEKIHKSLDRGLFDGNRLKVAGQVEPFFNFAVYSDCTPKHHTIRAGHRWKAGEWFSPRVWSGKPYNSKQIIIAPDVQVKKTWDFELHVFGVFQKVLVTIDRNVPKQNVIPTLACNDGLTVDDFEDWFLLSREFKRNQVFEGQIICWNESIEYCSSLAIDKRDSMSKKDKCPKCNGNLRLTNGDQLYCEKCFLYKVDDIWMRVSCDEYHRHTRNCLIEWKETVK